MLLMEVMVLPISDYDHFQILEHPILLLLDATSGDAAKAAGFIRDQMLRDTQSLRINIRKNLVAQQTHCLERIENQLCYKSKVNAICNPDLKKLVKYEVRKAVHMLLHDHLRVSIFV